MNFLFYLLEFRLELVLELLRLLVELLLLFLLGCFCLAVEEALLLLPCVPLCDFFGERERPLRREGGDWEWEVRRVVDFFDDEAPCLAPRVEFFVLFLRLFNEFEALASRVLRL